MPDERVAVDDERTIQVLFDVAGQRVPAHGQLLSRSMFGTPEELRDACGHSIAASDFTGDGAAGVVVSNVLEGTATITSS